MLEARIAPTGYACASPEERNGFNGRIWMCCTDAECKVFPNAPCPIPAVLLDFIEQESPHLKFRKDLMIQMKLSELVKLRYVS
jgi:hypothetical protein